MRPTSAARWLAAYLPRIKVIYAFQVLSLTDDGEGWGIAPGIRPGVHVEAGQLMFIAAVLLLWAGLGRLRFPQWAWRVPVYAIGSLAAFWTIERIAGFA